MGVIKLKKRIILSLIIIFLFVTNNVFFALPYEQPSSKHWAAPYANNFSQRLIPVKKALTEDSDIRAEDIHKITTEVLEAKNFNEPISFSNWQRILRIIFGKQISESNASGGNINRENAVASVMELLKEKVNLKPSTMDTLAAHSQFSDSYDISEDKVILIGLAYNQGLISGYGDATFRPKDNLRNSEALVLIDKVCSKYGLPETQWNGDIGLIKIDNYIKVEGPEAIEEALWTNDKGILLVYSTEESNIREAAKVFVNENRSVKALKYNSYNLSESLFNESAFTEERGYISANKIIWSKNRRYVNMQGELKNIYIPYVNFWVSKDNRMVLLPDEEKNTVKIYDFLTESSTTLEQYFRWADAKYTRAVKWSPDSRYMISTLHKPEDDIGIEEKTRFAIFDCRSGKLVKVIDDYGYYSFYPTWSADGNKVAFYRVKIDDSELKDYLNNIIDIKFDLLAKEIGIYDVNTGEIKYYPHPEGVILAKYENSIVWSPQSDKLYIETAADKEALLNSLDENRNLDLQTTANEVWELNLKSGQYTKILATGEVDSKEVNDVYIEELVEAGNILPIEENDMDFNKTDDIYSLVQKINSVSLDGKRILYSKRLNNLMQYENTSTQFMMKDLDSDKEMVLNDAVLTYYWWLSDGSLLFVENEFSRSRYGKIAYIIKKIDKDFNIQEIARFIQYPTAISISPDKHYLMLHQYRDNKDVKLINLREQ